ncbi:beta-lactamase domain protein (plasmid) [Gemmatirosa kalamazoonensis]|uniref:Beta-lactamase domain protein n=1 Tax=Gemmatirosa kalamazoonensis TaxID=861299 RepID=W0RQ39_9BACT|nr:MBL fold metallo-hydrolase [Gemmatirosa kalamazoonensis]AHG92455.1 beta-lactamase domain protein [Gemmatirosa kalamazoonensis]
MSRISRRDFLAHTGSCAAHLALAAAALPAPLRAAWAQRPLGAVVAREPFGTLERVADGVWALVSTPLGGDRTTLCNGGIVVGRERVLAVEGFFQPAGAAWLAARAKELTGRWPTHVALTHFHADHTSGVAGYFGEARPQVSATERTHTLVHERNLPADAARTAALADAVLLSATEASTFDLGGRVVRFVPRDGHTPSDASLELEEPSVVFAGDLVWNAMFPNYVDATPSRLARSVAALRRARDTVYVPGHGPLGRLADLDRYMSMLGEVERAARAAHAAGKTAAEGAAAFTLPAALGDWVLLNPVFYERAFAAWYRELAG